MSSPEAAAAPTPDAWPALGIDERRVLGVLVEKMKTTPDAYPMSVNALVTGGNQKTNRDPIMDLSDVDVEEALTTVQKKGLAVKLVGGRVIRWKHNLYETWKVGKVELSVLCELLLRGPQTEGELRARVSRMDAVDDLDALRALCRPLAERRMVVYLTPEGRRGTVLTHGFHAPDELERLRARHAGAALDDDEPRAAPRAASPSVPERPDVEPRLGAAQAELAALRQTVADLRAELDAVKDQVRALRAGLGM